MHEKLSRDGRERNEMARVPRSWWRSLPVAARSGHSKNSTFMSRTHARGARLPALAGHPVPAGRFIPYRIVAPQVSDGTAMALAIAFQGELWHADIGIQYE